MAGAMPGTKILGGEILPCDLPQVFVYIGRIDLDVFTGIELILEQLLTGEVLAFLDDFGDPAIMQRDVVLLLALAAETQANRIAMNIGVTNTQGRQPERLVGLGVFFVPNSYAGLIQ